MYGLVLSKEIKYSVKKYIQKLRKTTEVIMKQSRQINKLLIAVWDDWDPFQNPTIGGLSNTPRRPGPSLRRKEHYNKVFS